MIDKGYEMALRRAFANLHGCEAQYAKTIPVIERWKGKTVWEGDVEMFYLAGHPKAARGYAWAYDKAKGSEIVAVLELSPVMSAQTAVQAAVVGKLKEQARN